MAIPTLRWALKRLAERGDIEANVYPHRFRHTYACQLLDNGAPLDFIQGMLGHEKASTTQICAQLCEERRRELYRRFFSGDLKLFNKRAEECGGTVIYFRSLFYQSNTSASPQL